MARPVTNITKNEFTLNINGFEIFQEFQEMLEADPINQLAYNIANVYLWVLFAIGVPANILTIITIVTLQAISPATLLIAVVAALDGTSLIFKLTGHQMLKNGVYLGNGFCKLEFILIAVTSLTNCVLALVCFERFLTVCYKAEKAKLFTIRKCLLALVIISAFIFTLFGAISMPMREAILKGYKCSTYPEFKWFWINVWYWINGSFYLFLPVSFIIPMTVKMVWTLHRRIQREKSSHEKDLGTESEGPKLEPTSEGENEWDDNEGGFTLMIILAAVLFVVLCLPACIYLLAYRYSHDKVVQAHWALFEQVQHVLADSTHVINFFLYAAAAKAFRSQVAKLIFCKPCRKRSQTAVLTAAE